MASGGLSPALYFVFAGGTPHPEGHSPTRFDTPSSQSVSPMMPQLSPGKPPVWAGADSFKHEAGQELLMSTASPSPVGSGDLSGAAAAVAAGGALEPLAESQGPSEAHQVSSGGASKLSVAGVLPTAGAAACIRWASGAHEASF